MANGQQINSGQGSVGWLKSWDLAGSASTTGVGQTASSMFVPLRSKKIGGGAATRELTGLATTMAFGFPVPTPVFTPLGMSIASAQGSYGKIRDKPLSGIPVSTAQGILTALGQGGGSNTLSWQGVAGTTRYEVGWDTVTHASGDKNFANLYPTNRVINVGTATSWVNNTGLAIFAAVRRVRVIGSETDIGPWSVEKSLSA